MISLSIQRKVQEVERSIPQAAVAVGALLQRARAIIRGNNVFRRFLASSAFLIVGMTASAFYTASALRQFHSPESIVGIFAILSIGSQIVGSALIGIVSDRLGTHRALQICAITSIVSTGIALIANSAEWYYAVFVFAGITLGAETLTRYSFAAECAPADARAFYVGLMNAWLAPFYLFNVAAGLLSNLYGYRMIFYLSFASALVGLMVLARISNPRNQELADRSN